ncbi:hypothetical protein ACLB2K_016027 [Fragaria x ananassa]
MYSAAAVALGPRRDWRSVAEQVMAAIVGRNVEGWADWAENLEDRCGHGVDGTAVTRRKTGMDWMMNWCCDR